VGSNSESHAGGPHYKSVFSNEVCAFKMASTSLSATHQSEFLQETAIPYQRPIPTRSKKVLQANDRLGNDTIVSGQWSRPWLKQTLQWSVGTLMEMKFLVDGKEVLIKGIVTNNTDLTLIGPLEKGEITFLFDDGDTIAYPHKGFFSKNDAIALPQTDPSTLLANSLLSLLSNKRPNIALIGDVVKFGSIHFKSDLQRNTNALLNSEPGSEDRTDRMRRIVNLIKQHHETLKKTHRPNKAVLRWLSSIVTFESHFPVLDGSPSVNAVALSNRLESVEVEEVSPKVLNLIYCTAN
jgi:hypothetical protein